MSRKKDIQLTVQIPRYSMYGTYLPIYLHLSYELTIHVGKYTSPIECLGYFGIG